MIVKRLRMEGIRSYRKAEVEFPMGKTLFEGDIGSGKSTILMAIEFALFGLGSARASSLLRVGESRGSVELDFEAGGEDYSVRRVLARKAGSIQQVEGRLKGPEGEEDYPATEMKERILEILNFREPTQPNAKSLLFQYAVYSPQEEMKLILALRPNDRLSILRRAFGVEEYKTAMENARELVRKVHEKRSRFQVAAMDLPALKREVSDLEGRAGRGDAELANLERAEKEQEDALEQLGKEKEGLHEIVVQLASASKEREHRTRETKSLRDEIFRLEADVERLEHRRSRLARDSPGSPPSSMTVRELKLVAQSIGERIATHRESDAKIGVRIGQFESVAERGRCPVCEQEADEAVFAGKISSLAEERKKNQVHLERLNEELRKADELLE